MFPFEQYRIQLYSLFGSYVIDPIKVLKLSWIKELEFLYYEIKSI